MENENLQREHFYFIMGEVTFIAEGKTPNDRRPVPVRLNCNITCEKQELRARDIARAQFGLQTQLQQRLAGVVDQPVAIAETIVHSITYMGHFTREEFLEGTNLE